MPSQITYKPNTFSSPNSPKNTTVFHPDSSGKEKDAETGYHYFGARYYNSDLSLWLSVDPMSDKYPSLSPYNYCAWNPLKIVDPDGMETIDNDDGWIVDKQNKTITRVRLDGGDRVQFVEGDAGWRWEESRSDLLERYKDYMFIDNIQHEAYLNSSDNKSESNDDLLGTVAGTVVGGASLGCNKMSKTIFDFQNGTYMGKDGSIKPIRRGKNGGLNGKYKSQIELSAKYGKAASGLKRLGYGMAAWSAWETERQARNGEISAGERVTNHIVNGVSFLPYCWHVPIFYELGKKYGPSSW